MSSRSASNALISVFGCSALAFSALPALSVLAVLSAPTALEHRAQSEAAFQSRCRTIHRIQLYAAFGCLLMYADAPIPCLVHIIIWEKRTKGSLRAPHVKVKRGQTGCLSHWLPPRRQAKNTSPSPSCQVRCCRIDSQFRIELFGLQLWCSNNIMCEGSEASDVEGNIPGITQAASMAIGAPTRTQNTVHLTDAINSRERTKTAAQNG